MAVLSVCAEHQIVMVHVLAQPLVSTEMYWLPEAAGRTGTLPAYRRRGTIYWQCTRGTGMEDADIAGAIGGRESAAAANSTVGVVYAALALGGSRRMNTTAAPFTPLPGVQEFKSA